MNLCGYGQRNIFAYDSLNIYLYCQVPNIHILLWYFHQLLVDNVDIRQCLGGLAGTVTTDIPQHGLWWWSLTQNPNFDCSSSLLIYLFLIAPLSFMSVIWPSLALIYARMHSLIYFLFQYSFSSPTQVTKSPFNTAVRWERHIRGEERWFNWSPVMFLRMMLELQLYICQSAGVWL